jgi:hypothetical protein
MPKFSHKDVMDILYDAANGTPVSIKAHVLSLNEWHKEQSVIERDVDPFGTAWAEHRASGKAKVDDPEFGGLFVTDGNTTIDILFAGRAPEQPDANTRTFTVVYVPAADANTTPRSVSVETILESYSVVPNRENGLTRYAVKLVATGAVTNVFVGPIEE